MSTGILMVLFLAVFAVTGIAAYTTWNVSEDRRRKSVDKRLRRSSAKKQEAEPDLLIKNVTSDIPFFGRLLEKFAFTDKLRKQLMQADLNWSVGRLAAMMLVSAFVVLNVLARIKILPFFVLPPGMALAGFLPYGYVLAKRKRRLALFEEQFPDALDFLGRALRAGHGFSVSLEMLSQEVPEPLAGEFRQTFDEHNLGLPVEVALTNLGRRIPLLDVRFFVSAVLLQSRTGGNLSEILDKLAYVIRERFKLKGQVRAYSAHGRLTGKILTAMPIVIVVLMMIVNPKYIMILVDSPYGSYLIGGAILMQSLAYMIIRKIVNIKV